MMVTTQCSMCTTTRLHQRHALNFHVFIHSKIQFGATRGANSNRTLFTLTHACLFCHKLRLASHLGRVRADIIDSLHICGNVIHSSHTIPHNNSTHPASRLSRPVCLSSEHGGYPPHIQAAVMRQKVCSP